MYNNIYDGAYYAAGTATLGLAMMAGMMIFSFILCLIYVISYWKIFKKANKPGWASIVPFYNIIIMLQIGKLPMWYLLLFFMPVANIYALFKINIEIAKKFGKETAFGIGMTLLGVIFIPLLAFSDNTYEDNQQTTSNENNFNNNTNTTANLNANENQNINMTTNNVVTPEIGVTEPTIAVDPEVVQPTAPVIEEPVQNAFESAPVIDVASEPTVAVEPEVVQPTAPVIEEPVQNAFESAPVIDVASEPTIAVEPQVVQTVEPVIEEPVQNAFESAPVIDVAPEPTIAVEPEVVQPTAPVIEQQPVQNAFESAPVIDVAPESTIAVEPEVVQTVEPDNKLCKNCNNELPNIVSICPNCGTDNE